MSYTKRTIEIEGKEYEVDILDGFDALKGIINESLYKYINEVYEMVVHDFNNDIDELNYEISESENN